MGTPTLVKALPAIQQFSGGGLFLFSDFTGAQPQREAPNDKFVFNIRASYRQETAALVKNFAKLGLKKIGVFATPVGTSPSPTSPSWARTSC